MRTTIIEYLRQKMIDTAIERGSLTHPDVIAISQQLDRFIVVIQRNRLAPGIQTEGSHSVIPQALKLRPKHLVSFKSGRLTRAMKP